MANQVLYGFHNLKDVFARRITTVGANVVNAAILASVAEHNRQMNAFLSLFARRTVDYTLRYKTPSSARLQGKDEFGKPRPIKPAGYYDVAWPVQEAAAAWGADYLAKVKMTVEEANEATMTLISADVRWMRDHVLAALYTNASWSFADDQYGALTIKGLANGDTDVYQILTGADVPATDTHYLAQANAISDTDNPFPTIYDELKEHPENLGEVIVLVPSNLVSAIMGLANFYEATDPALRAGSGVTQLVGNLATPVPGEVIGRVDKCWIAEWRSLPDSYMIAVTDAGEKALALREHPESELQGFNRVASDDSHPFYNSIWERYAGFGAWNRVGGLVYRVGNASYAIPTNYTSPMA
jgi:hypothetical protein